MGIRVKSEGNTYLDRFILKTRCLADNSAISIEPDKFSEVSLEEMIQGQMRILSNDNDHPYTGNTLYIHIPFCLTRCSYCPYYVTQYTKKVVEEYIDILAKEIKKVKETAYIKSTSFQNIYFGGGTPSVLNIEQIERICKLVFDSFNIERNGEFTFESNPQTLTDEKIRVLKKCGINRVSLGVQTFNDKMLKEMNCVHTVEQTLNVINALLKEGVMVNVDLMYGLIGQTEEDLYKDISVLETLEGLQHITYYPLVIMKGTPLEKQLLENGVDIDKHRMTKIKYFEIILNNLREIGFVVEKEPIMFHRKGCQEHSYVSTRSRVIGIGAGAGTIIDSGEYLNTNSLEEYKSFIEKEGMASKFMFELNKEDSYNRTLLFSIIYCNRSAKNFEETINSIFRHYHQFEDKTRLKKVIDELVEKELVYMDNRGHMIFTDKMQRLLQLTKIGIPSII